MRTFEFTENPVGVLTAEDVPPGDYLAKIFARDPKIAPGPDALQAKLTAPFHVPAEVSTNRILDLGELLLERPHERP